MRRHTWCWDGNAHAVNDQHSAASAHDGSLWPLIIPFGLPLEAVLSRLLAATTVPCVCNMAVMTATVRRMVYRQESCLDKVLNLTPRSIESVMSS